MMFEVCYYFQRITYRSLQKGVGGDYHAVSNRYAI